MNTFRSTSGLSFEDRCRAFELEYHMSSDEFMQRFEAGELGDDAIYFDWYAAKCGLDVMRRKQDGTGDDS
jgi:hypothetical protein